MSTQNSTKANSKAPVSSHPLFPAIVALWFGALFGLGSLAVRASLIESLVIASHLDVIVPMAAPPLGMTARILLALFMAMMGIAGGAAIARRIARPKPVSRNRRRTAASVNEARKAEFVREVQAQQVEQQVAADKADAVRRRALASDEVNYTRSHQDEMPLPGGNPQILDVTQFDLATPGSFEADLAKETHEEAPLDLTGFAALQAAFQEPVHAAPVVESELVEPAEIELVDIQQPAPVMESYGDDTDSFRAKFANEKKPAVWMPEPPLSHAESFETKDPVDDAAEFVTETADSAAPSRFDPVPPTDEDQPQDQTDFALQGCDLAAPDLVSDNVAGPAEMPAKPEVAAVADVPELRRFEGPASAPQFSPVVGSADISANHAHAAPAMKPAATPEAPPSLLRQGNAAERIATAELAELSPVELVERFALALKQRCHTGAFPASLLATAAAFDLPVGPQPSQVPEVLAGMAPFVEPVVASEAEASEAITVPETMVTAQPLFAESPSDSSETEDAPVAATCAPLALPVAMRPIEFGNHEEHYDLPDYVPPRSIARPRPADAPVDIVQAVDARPQATSVVQNPFETPAEPEAEADVSEDGYSSLLALSRTAPLRQTFVRIEEPTSDQAHVEPVVIFPGQATRPGTRFARPSDSDPSAEPTAATPQSPAELPQAAAPDLRRFDVPAGATPGKAAVQDPAEAERALRSALATLQRMSGAA
ncbi:MAG: hypothetical protein ABIM50_03460 [Novosphingobium sp.]